MCKAFMSIIHELVKCNSCPCSRYLSWTFAQIAVKFSTKRNGTLIGLDSVHMYFQHGWNEEHATQQVNALLELTVWLGQWLSWSWLIGFLSNKNTSVNNDILTQWSKSSEFIIIINNDFRTQSNFKVSYCWRDKGKMTYYLDFLLILVDLRSGKFLAGWGTGSGEGCVGVGAESFLTNGLKNFRFLIHVLPSSCLIRYERWFFLTSIMVALFFWSWMLDCNTLTDWKKW